MMTNNPIQVIADRLITVPVIGLLMNSITHQVFEFLFKEQDLSFLDDRKVCVYCSTFKLAMCYSRKNEKLCLLATDEWDVKISVDLSSMLKLMFDQVDSDTLFFQRKLKLQGDTALGLSCKNLLDTIDRNRMPKHIQQFIMKRKLSMA